MHFLKRAFDLAEARGYFRYPEVIALQDQVPDWFLRLGTEVGLAEFEAGCGHHVPRALREFYSCLPLACFLEATMDGEVFLRNMSTDSDPPIESRKGIESLVFSFHCHSGMVMAAEFGADDPLVWSGFGGDDEPSEENVRPPLSFATWVFTMVDGYEAKLDFWQRLYEERQANPAERRRAGDLAWVRNMPGMSMRFARR